MISEINMYSLNRTEKIEGKKSMIDDKAPPAPAAGGGGCPFRGVMQRVGLSQSDPAGAEQGQTAPGVCPFSGAKSSIGRDEASSGPPSTSTAAPAGGVCPLGFGRSEPGGPPLSRLHCPRCKSLFHDCVLLGCGHRFCASCVGGGGERAGEGGGGGGGGGGGDCLACGADIASRRPDAEAQALADAALEDAARADSEGEAQAWLRAAMSSAAGGNHAAALARAARAAAALEEELLASPPSSSSDAATTAVRRAAVSGVIGDSHRSLGNLGAAAEKYQGAVAVLEGALSAERSLEGGGGGGGGGGENPAASSSPPLSLSLRELTRALTVTLNKLGDLLYLSASAAEARPLYARALRERLLVAGAGAARAGGAGPAPSSSPPSAAAAAAAAAAAIPPAGEGDAERASDLIDAGLSAAKVADADAAAAAAGGGGGEEGGAAAAAAAAVAGGLRLAAALLAAGAAGAAAAGGPLAARAERLRAFLESSISQGK